MKETGAPSAGGTSALEVAGLHVSYGRVEAVRGVSLRVGEGKIVTLIQPAGEFYRAEEYHQRYFEKHGGGSCHI